MARKSEEASMAAKDANVEVVTAFRRIPYSLINAETEDNGISSNILAEFTEISQYYKIYKKGVQFLTEGSNGDYVPAQLKYMLAATLINKEARFLFAEPPDLTVESKGDVGKVSEDSKKALTVLNDLVKTVLDANNFEEALLKAAKDCFIGKRIAGLVNFNEEDGVTVTFLPSTQFIYETKIGNPNILTKFVCFIIVRDSIDNASKRIFRKRYTFENDEVWLEEAMFDGAGGLIEHITERQKVLLTTIPAVIFINDGLTGENEGESEISQLKDFEQWFSLLSNADKDAERKNMNPIRYAINMDNNSTKGLSSSAGAFWDLQVDQNVEGKIGSVGTLESQMNYSEALKTTLDRIKTSAYEALDMPNVSLESMQGAITSGKALKAVYWPLIVRCKEKMKTWGPGLRKLVTIIIEGAMLYPDCIKRYTDDDIEAVKYEISVEQNHPLPEDEVEERNMDLAEVSAKTMSRKAYMQKWRILTDEEVESELEQMALERQILEDSSFAGTAGDDAEMDDSETLPYDI